MERMRADRLKLKLRRCGSSGAEEQGRAGAVLLWFHAGSRQGQETTSVLAELEASLGQK